MCKLSTYADRSCNNARMKEWDDLRYFLAVARNGSVTAAAAKLGVNHSTVSRRIQAFEEKHDVRLFERLPSGYEMSQAAENIYQKALEIEAKTQDIERELFGQDTRLQGRVVITAPNIIINHFIMPFVGRFREQYPDIDLEFLATADLKNMAAREADIAIRFTPQPPEYLVGRQVASLTQGIYVHKDYPLQDQEHQSIILWHDEIAFPSWVQNYFPSAKVTLRADTIATMVAAVKNGMGIAHMPRALGEIEDDFYRLNLELPPPSWGVWVLSHVDLRATARIRVCREFIVDVLQQQRSIFEGENSRYVSD